MNYLVIITVQGNTADGQPLAQHTYATQFNTDGTTSEEQNFNYFRERAEQEWRNKYANVDPGSFSVPFFDMRECRR